MEINFQYITCKKLSQKRGEHKERRVFFKLILTLYGHCYYRSFFWIHEKFSSNDSAI